MLESQPRSTVLETQARPTSFEAQPRPAALESQPRPPIMLEGPARSTGFISQSQSQSQSQGSQRVAASERMGKEDVVREIVQHCTALYKFADHYSTLQSSNPHLQPPAEELAEMTARAGEVVRLLEALRNDTPIFPSSLLSTSASPSTFTSPSGPASHALVSVHPHSLEAVKGHLSSSSSLGMGIMDVDAPDRAPKRPWEDVEGMLPPGSGPGIAPSSSAGHVHVPLASAPAAQVPATTTAGVGVPSGQDQDRSMAEADMELIRTKRALTTMAAAAALGGNGGGGGGGKNKYRKRSRATPPGKCHSCNIRETPEWRRGPDGARTLCNACGLHYAKLVRKREKALANGETPSIQRIDMEMLRASARAADADKGARAALGGGSAGGAVMNSVTGNGHGHGSSSGSGSGGADDKMNLGIHQGSFQINTDAGDAMQDQDPALNSQSSGSGGGGYTRPPRPANSKRPSSGRVMQSPGIGMGGPGQHPSAGGSHQTPAMSHHTTPSGSHLSTPSAHHQTSSTQHHQTPSTHHQTPSVQHHQTPSMPHHTTPSMTHQSANSSSGSTSRHAPAASHTPAAQPASQQNQGHHQAANASAHHPSAAQGHHPSTSTQGHHQSAAQGHQQSTSAQGHHQPSVHHPSSRPGPPPTPPWYLPAANQSHSMLRQ